MLFALWQIMQQCESEKLKMYLRGIGGTGKSQVIKALVYFFTQQNEEHR
jgi:predicted AAA+ superfamily ATPase